MEKVYKNSLKSYVKSILILSVFLFFSFMSFLKGHMLFGALIASFTLLGIIFILFNQNSIKIDDECIELSSKVGNKRCSKQKVKWDEITTIKEDHFWDVLTYLYIYSTDKNSTTEKLGVFIGMVTDYKNYKDLALEISKRSPKSTKIVGDFARLLK